MPTVAWRDDGATRSGSTSTAFRVVTDETKRDMPGAASEAFTDALVRRTDAIARAEHARKVALESVKFHRQASHISPDFRDCFNATIDQAIRAAAPPQGEQT